MRVKPFPWGHVETELLRRNYSDSSNADLAGAIGCTAEQVARRAFKLGLHKSREHLTLVQQARVEKRAAEMRTQPRSGPRFIVARLDRAALPPGITAIHQYRLRGPR